MLPLFHLPDCFLTTTHPPLREETGKQPEDESELQLEYFSADFFHQFQFVSQWTFSANVDGWVPAVSCSSASSSVSGHSVHQWASEVTLKCGERQLGGGEDVERLLTSHQSVQ